nr:hypothetical protein [Pirellulaceae bacterium]
LTGTQSIGPTGEHIVLRADLATAENSLDEPLRIQPQRQALAGCSRKFTVELAPRSVNVLRIPAEPTQPE